MLEDLAELRALFDEAWDLGPGARQTMLERLRDRDPMRGSQVAELLRLAVEGDLRLRNRADQEEAGLDPDAWIGRRLGPYRIVRVLDRGGMSSVFEAVHEARPEQASVALKVSLSELKDATARRRFELEAQLLRRLDHPGIARLIEAGVYREPTEEAVGETSASVRTRPWFAMELVEGARDLMAYAEEEELERSGRLRLFDEVCQVVEHAHRCGVLHRDLKPSNVLVDGDGRVRLIDFGIARAIGREEARGELLTRTGQVLGTLAYASPEQVRGARMEIDERTDVHALGVLLFELLTGQAAFDRPGQPWIEVVRSIVEEPLPTAELDVEEAEWIARATAKEPGERFAGVSELREALASHGSGMAP